MTRFAFTLLLLGGALALAQEYTKATPADVKKAVADKKAVLVDVREPKEWDAGHLADAKSLPLSKIKAGVPNDELAKLLPKDQPVYLHCKAGGRCLTAAELLKKQGYDVRPLKDGYDALLDAGFPKAK